jgi:carbonic anhydrase
MGHDAGLSRDDERPVGSAQMFDDVLRANEAYRQSFRNSGLSGSAARGLAVLTCIDSRIDPLAMLGLSAGDAKIIRNAGARATPDALRSLVLATNLLGVDRICVIQHTDCAMSKRTEDELRALVGERAGAPADGWEFLVMDDQLAALADDVATIRECPLLHAGVVVGGFRYDVTDGSLTPIDV